jgi:hypothetical protein
MQTRQRRPIPSLNKTAFDGVLVWLSQLQQQGLLFHREDDSIGA